MSAIAPVLEERLIDRVFVAAISNMWEYSGRSAPVAAFGLLATIYQRAGLYLVATMQDAASTGYFSAVLRVVEAPKFFHVAVLGALLPSMSFAYSQVKKSKKQGIYSKVFTISFWGLLAVSVLASFLLFSFAFPLSFQIFGQRFLPAFEILRILCWSLIPFSITQYLAVRMLAAKEEKLIIYALVVGLIVLIGLSLLWIPQSGSVGAALAAVVAESFLALIFILLSRWAIREKKQKH